jgi:hypothetical protein
MADAVASAALEVACTSRDGEGDAIAPVTILNGAREVADWTAKRLT